MVSLYFLSVTLEFFYSAPCCRLLLPPGSEKQDIPIGPRGPEIFPIQIQTAQLLSLPRKALKERQQHGAGQGISVLSVHTRHLDLLNTQILIR